MAAVGSGLPIRSSWSRKLTGGRLGALTSTLRPAGPSPRATNPIFRWFLGGDPLGVAAGLGIAAAVAGSIAASAGSASGSSNVTGGSFPPLSIGRAAVIQLSYRNPANPLTGTIVAGGADLTVSAINAGTDELTVTAHGFTDFSGDGPVVWDTATGGTVPAGLTNGAQYWIGIVNANTLKLATSDVNAATGVWVNITSAGSGTHTLKRAQNTQAAQSIIIAAAIRGDWDNTPGAPYDNYGNTFTSVDAGPYSYAAWPTAKMGVFSSPYNITAGGLDHRVSLDYSEYTPAGAEADEVTVGWVEILGPAEVIATSYQEVTVPAASFNSASITISRAARIICIVGGSAGLGQQHVMTFSGITGITKIAAASAEAEISANGYCQLSMAHADVDPAGTPTSYTATVAGTSNEVGKIWLVAVAVPQVGLASGSGSAVGVGGSVVASAGAASGTSSADAGGQAVVAADGSAAGTGTASGAAASGDGAGSAAGVGSAAGAGTAIVGGAGSASGTASAAAAGAATSAAAGAAAGTSTPAAVGASTAASAGSAAGSGTAAGTGASTAAGAGASAGAATVAGVGAATTSAAGSSSGVATIGAAGASTAAGAGALAGVGSAAAVGAATTSSAGAASGAATVSGAGASVAAGTGTASGTGSAAASADAGLAVGGTSGAGSAAGAGNAIVAAAGASSGVGSAAGATNTIVAADGAAAGAAAAAAVGSATIASDGSAAGIGDAAAASNVIVGAAGAASGISTATASSIPPVARPLPSRLQIDVTDLGAAPFEIGTASDEPFEVASSSPSDAPFIV